MTDYTLLQQIKIRLRQFHMEGNKMVFDDLKENPIIEALLDNAKESVIKCRNYPSSWTKERIDEDLENYKNVLINLVIYDYNKEGMEYENSHSESGVSRQFSSRARVMADVVPFVDMIF